MDLNVSKSTLLVIDMQKFLLDLIFSTFICGGLSILQNIKNLINAFPKK
ncbi:MAG: hypothetical protein ACUVQ1_08405 [Candidatus Kapaibacteriales bacterium]